MARVSVIGGNGFLGSHTVDTLAGVGHQVSAFDLFNEGPLKFTSPDIRTISGDFFDDDSLQRAVADQDYVIHMLSTTTPATADSDPSLDVRTNVTRTISLLEACVTAGVQKIYFASTGGAIYGSQGHVSYGENDLTLPVSPYAIGKLTIERYLEFFRISRGLDYVVARISNPYGPRQDPHLLQGLIPIALRKIRAGHPVIRLGDGSMIRDYVYVTDVADAFARLIGATTEHRTYNIGSGQGLTVNEILETLRKVTGVDFPIENRPTPPTFVDCVVLNIARFSREFGEIARVTLTEGVQKTWKAIEVTEP